MDLTEAEEFQIEQREAKVERALIERFLHERGYSLHTLATLPPDQAKHLMVEASTYACLKVEEMKDTARFVHELHGFE